MLKNIAPIGCTKVHYAEDDGTFKSAYSPASLYGGTWSLKWNTDYIYMSSEGGSSSQTRTSGIQPDQTSDHLHYPLGGASDVILSGNGPTGFQSGGSYGIKLASATGLSKDSGDSNYRKGTFNHPRNRLVRYYEREA